MYCRCCFLTDCSNIMSNSLLMPVQSNVYYDVVYEYITRIHKPLIVWHVLCEAQLSRPFYCMHVQLTKEDKVSVQLNVNVNIYCMHHVFGLELELFKWKTIFGLLKYSTRCTGQRQTLWISGANNKPMSPKDVSELRKPGLIA